MFFVTSDENTIYSVQLTNCQAKVNYSSYLSKLTQLVEFESSLI